MKLKYKTRTGVTLTITWTGSVWQYRGSQCADESTAMKRALMDWLAENDEIPEHLEITDYRELDLNKYGKWEIKK